MRRQVEMMVDGPLSQVITAHGTGAGTRNLPRNGVPVAIDQNRSRAMLVLSVLNLPEMMPPWASGMMPSTR